MKPFVRTSFLCTRPSCLPPLEDRFSALTTENAKISAVHSLADICFLHVLIWLIKCIILSVCVSGIFGVKNFAYSYISVLFIRIRPFGL